MKKPQRVAERREPVSTVEPAASPFGYRDYLSAKSTLIAAAKRGPFYGCLSGSSGVGKTSLARELAVALDRHEFILLYVAASRVSTTGFARHLAGALRAPVRRSALEMGRVVTEALRALPTHAIVWVDEADRLPFDTLTEVRTLAECDESVAQTFSVVLSGAPELVATLDEQRLFALKRRISVPITLTGLARDEVEAFLLHRFGSADAARVPNPLIDELFERAQGAPALIDTLARTALERARPHKLEETHLREALHVLRL